MILSYHDDCEPQLLQDDIWKEIDTYAFEQHLIKQVRGLIMPTKRKSTTISSGIACHLTTQEVSTYDNGSKYINYDTAVAKTKLICKAVERLREGKLLKLVSIDTVTTFNPITFDWLAYFYIMYNE